MYNRHMEIIRADEVQVIRDGGLLIQEYDFENSMLNVARITISGRYPAEGYVANRMCTALVSVEEGAGSITIKNKPTVDLTPGDHILIQPGEPYCFLSLGDLAIRYISTPAWRANQVDSVE